MHHSTTPARRQASGGWLIAFLLLGVLLGIAGDRMWSPERGVVERSLALPPARARDEGVADDSPEVEAKRIPVASEATRDESDDPDESAPARLDATAALVDGEPRIAVELRLVLPDGSAPSEAEVTIRRPENGTGASASRPRLPWTPSHPIVELPLGTSFLSAAASATLRSAERRLTFHPGDRRRIVLALSEKSELHGRLRLPDPHVHATCLVALAEVPRHWRPELAEIAATTIREGNGPWQSVAPSSTDFVFKDVEPGRRLVVVERVGKTVVRAIELVPGRNEIEIDMPPAEESQLLHVRVRNEQGQPLRDAKFTLYWRNLGSRDAEHVRIDGDGIATTEDGTYVIPFDEMYEHDMLYDANGLFELKAIAPDHAERTIALDRKNAHYEIVLPAVPTNAFTVQLLGDRDAIDRGLFVVELRRYADAIRRDGHGPAAKVDATGRALFDRVLPGPTTVVLHVRGASFLPAAPLAEQELVIDTTCSFASFEVPPLHDLTVAVPQRTAGDRIVGLASIDRKPVFRSRATIDEAGHARFFALPAGRYSVAYGKLATTIDLAASTEVALAAPDDR